MIKSAVFYLLIQSLINPTVLETPVPKEYYGDFVYSFIA
jgi:hypothetical protein